MIVFPLILMSIYIPTVTDITNVLDELASASIHNVPGLKEVHSGKAGPRLYLGMGTHGDERMGLALASPFLRNELRLLEGSIVLAINNIQGLLMSRRHVPGDRNFNRLPSDILERTDDLYSTRRIQALHGAGVFHVTHGFDAHTFLVPGKPVKLHIKGNPDFAHSIGISDYITNIVDFQKDNETGEKTVAFGNMLGGIENDSVPVVEVEGGGPHDEPHVVHGLLSGLLATLVKLGMVDPDEVGLEEQEIEQRTYRTCGWQRIDEGYEIVRDFAQYEEVKKGQLIATAEGKPSAVCPQDACMLFPSPKGVVKSTDSWFWAEPMQRSLVRAWVLR